MQKDLKQQLRKLLGTKFQITDENILIRTDIQGFDPKRNLAKVAIRKDSVTFSPFDGKWFSKPVVFSSPADALKWVESLGING
jgi:hypothetical protein